MRFLSIWKTVETNVPPTEEEIARMGALIEKMTKTGELIATEGCLPSALGARVRRAGKRVTVTDGPFTESKELIAGFALLEARSKEHAVELCKVFMESRRRRWRVRAEADLRCTAGGYSRRRP